MGDLYGYQGNQNLPSDAYASEPVAVAPKVVYTSNAVRSGTYDIKDDLRNGPLAIVWIILVLIVGFIWMPPVWALGFFFVKSKHGAVKAISFVCCVFCCIALCIALMYASIIAIYVIVLIVAAVVGVVSAFVGIIIAIVNAAKGG